MSTRRQASCSAATQRRSSCTCGQPRGSADVIGRIPLFDEEGRPEWSEHPELGASADVVAVPVGALLHADPATSDAPPAGLRGDMLLLEASPIVGFLPRGVVDVAQLAEDDRVVVVGFRGEAGDDDSRGQAIEAALVATRDSDRAGLPRFQCAGDTGPGLSGSPVFLLSENRQQGALVGMYGDRTPAGLAEFLDRVAVAKTAIVGTRPARAEVAKEHKPDPHTTVELPLRISGPPLPIDNGDGGLPAGTAAHDSPPLTLTELRVN